MARSRSNRWTKNMTDEEKRQFEGDWLASEPVREKLQEILYEMIGETQVARLKLEEYDKPNWELKQVQYNTKEKTLLALLNLV